MRPRGRAAVFLDRDGTVVEDAHYLADPERVTLIPGAAAAIRRMSAAGLPVVLVTNQSGIAHGLYTEEQYRVVARRVDELIQAAEARVDATYYCPHHPRVRGPLRLPEAGHGALPARRARARSGAGGLLLRGGQAHRRAPRCRPRRAGDPGADRVRRERRAEPPLGVLGGRRPRRGGRADPA